MLVGHARRSTDAQDLTAQRDALSALGVQPNRIYVDRGLTGTNRARLARSLTDARNTVHELTDAGVKLNIGGSVHGSDGKHTSAELAELFSVARSTVYRAGEPTSTQSHDA